MNYGTFTFSNGEVYVIPVWVWDFNKTFMLGAVHDDKGQSYTINIWTMDNDAFVNPNEVVIPVPWKWSEYKDMTIFTSYTGNVECEDYFMIMSYIYQCDIQVTFLATRKGEVKSQMFTPDIYMDFFKEKLASCHMSEDVINILILENKINTRTQKVELPEERDGFRWILNSL